jgi:23S rRNA (uracil1939-C5)-methyltransferase
MTYGYRNRLQFKVATQHGKTAIGFYRQGTHQVEDAAGGCPIAAPIINQTLNCFREVLRLYPGIETVTQLSIDSGDSGVIVIIHQSGNSTRKSREYLLSKTVDLWPCTGLFVKTERHESGERIWGESAISYRMSQADPAQKPVELLYPPGGFAQVHQRQNEALLAVLRRLGNFAPTEHLLDLYCGNGNFSLPLAAEVASVVGIEGSSASVLAAESNRDINKVANVSFFCDDAASGVSRLLAQEHKFDTVLLDPPRSGADDVVTGIAQLQPGKIIYVSCDPSTLARDCGLLSGRGYRVVTSVPVDMFPQTFHIESVTLLCR